MTTLAGTGKLIRLILRRERLRLGIWVVVLVVVPVFTATAFIDLYPDQASREALAATVASSPALTALLGPLYDSGIGGLTAWRAGTLGAFFVALMAILTMVRHTREEEETGRRELLGATVVGRHAPLVAALAVTIGAGLLVAGLLTAGLAGVGLPLGGILRLRPGVRRCRRGLCRHRRCRRTADRGVLDGARDRRRCGRRHLSPPNDRRLGWGGNEWVAWLSPIGWFSRLRPFADEQWWVLVLWLGLSAALITTAALVASRRDVGAGALPPRPGPADAAPGLRSPLGLAWRLQRGSVMGWTIGLAVLGGVYGAAGDSIQGMLEGNPQLQEIFEQMGGAQGLTDTFFSTVVGIIALITSAYAIRAVLRLDVEEEAIRAEWVLATATPRARYAWSHLIFGLAVPVLILAVAGLVAGATYGAIVGDVADQAMRVLGAAMLQLPAVWILTGTAMALYGLAPKRVALSWGVLVACLILGQLGQILRFPQWSLNLSPFTHIPVFGDDIEVLPLGVLLLVAGALVAAGLVGFRRRDMT